MAEITDRVPGGVIFASYANQIRDRAVMRYADAASRDASEPLPDTGELAYLTSTGEFQVFNGSVWATHITNQGGQIIEGTLEVQGTFTIRTTSTPRIINPNPDADAFLNFYHTDDANRYGYVGGVAGIFRVTSTDGYGLQLSSSSGVIIAADIVHSPDGTVDDPTYAFTTDTDLGMYRVSSNILGFTRQGVRAVQIRSDSQYRNNSGSASDTLRDILVGTTVPDNSWGKDGDIYIRYIA